jgi:hypothetical protein
MWGTRSFFDAQASAWVFDGNLEFPPRTARGHEGKMQGIERENSTGITVWARTESGDHGPVDAAEQNARMSVLHQAA